MPLRTSFFLLYEKPVLPARRVTGHGPPIGNQPPCECERESERERD